MSEQQPIIVWFRQDLRLTDNPALYTAVKSGQPIVPIYVLDDGSAGDWSMGEASRWWLHESLQSLDSSLGGGLCFFSGNAQELIPSLADQLNASQIVWNRCYEPWRIQRDADIKKALKSNGKEARSFKGSLLLEPQEVSKPDGSPYKVFTPFYRKAYQQPVFEPGTPLPAPEDLRISEASVGCELSDLGLMPRIRWYDEMAELWQPGEQGAHERLQLFLDSGIKQYKEGRDRPDQEYVSRLSPHLHFGELSPRQVWHAARGVESMDGLFRHVEHFLRELAWREFSYHLLYHSPEIPRKNLQQKFDGFSWRDDAESLHRWQEGQTGYPIVDAGMRELWRTGYMHNRVRMIVGSFLVKNLLLHWHHGEDWFWDTLLDADLANNSASWQWIAGCGADAAPFFRIFNPVTQGKKFDPNGSYVRCYVPELAELPDKYLHCPWDAPDDVLESANVRLNVNYPEPIVELQRSRERALLAFKTL